MKTISQLKKQVMPAAEFIDGKPKVRSLLSLKKIRLDAGLTMKEVGDAPGVTRQSIEIWEKSSGFNLYSALRLAKFYERPVESIWSIDEEVQP